jgi:predicted phage terminase large subunit-like protein
VTDFADLPLVDFIPAVSPQFRAPYHLAGWCSLIEACLQGGVRGCCAVPIRHHKTITTLHGVAWLLLRDPTFRIILMCADHERATELGKTLRKICEGVAHVTGEPIGPARGDNIILDWKNEKGGGVVCMSAEQSKLGRDVDVLLVDDALTEQTCNDPLIRDAIDNAIAHYTARAGRSTRRGSTLIVMSRWNADDPIGRRLARKAAPWTDVHDGAIVDMDLPTERAFAPEVMTLEEIKSRRAELREVDPSERLFWAQFQNDPRAQVDARFKEPKRYDFLPTWPGFRWGIGVDLAYTPGEGDWFACVTAKIYGSTAYVVDVVRERADFNVLENLIRNRWDKHGRCPIFSYISGPEKGAIRYFTDRGIPIQGLPARYSKATRAQKTIDRWNAGKILVPSHDAWVPGFVTRTLAFTGSDKARDDDEIDALVSLCDGMIGSDVANMPRAFGAPRM